MMTLDEAIRHERHAMRQTAGERSEEHRQLAEWLCELRQERMEIDLLKELVRDYDRVLSSMHALCDCDFVPLNDATLLALRSRMYELGIEVVE